VSADWGTVYFDNPQLPESHFPHSLTWVAPLSNAVCIPTSGNKEMKREVEEAVAAIGRGETRINLSSRGIGDADVASLAAALETSTFLRDIYLERNTITDVGAAALAAAVEKSASLCFVHHVRDPVAAEEDVLERQGLLNGGRERGGGGQFIRLIGGERG